MECIAYSLLECKRNNEMGWRLAYIAPLDMVHITACIAHSVFVCKRSNEMERRKLALHIWTRCTEWLTLHIDRWFRKRSNAMG